MEESNGRIHRSYSTNRNRWKEGLEGSPEVGQLVLFFLPEVARPCFIAPMDSHELLDIAI